MTNSSPVDRARRLLRQLMAEKELREEDLARGLGCSPAELKERLSGESLLGLDWLDAALGVVEVPPAEFFSRLYRDSSAEDGGEEKGSGRREAADPDPGGGAANDPPQPQDPPAAAAEDEVLTREEVETLIAEARSLIRGSSRMIDARRRADDQQADGAPEDDPERGETRAAEE